MSDVVQVIAAATRGHAIPIGCLPAPTVQTAQGQTCSTPCSLALPVNAQAVSFSLSGYRAANGAARGAQGPGSMFSEPPPDLVPNPLWSRNSKQSRHRRLLAGWSGRDRARWLPDPERLRGQHLCRARPNPLSRLRSPRRQRRITCSLLRPQRQHRPSRRLRQRDNGCPRASRPSRKLLDPQGFIRHIPLII